jgi:uncharacterized membrane protein
MNFVKTTVIGGIFFLIPVVVLVLVVGKAIGLMMTVAEPVSAVLPVQTIGDIALINILAIVAVVLLCFVAGLIAQTRLARKLAESVEAAILDRIPGYTMFRGMTSGLKQDTAAQLQPVMVSHMGVQRIGLEVEKVRDDRSAVYFPNAPNVWTGVVEIVPADNIEPMESSMMDIIEYIEKMGRGSHHIMAAKDR